MRVAGLQAYWLLVWALGLLSSAACNESAEPVLKRNSIKYSPSRLKEADKVKYWKQLEALKEDVTEEGTIKKAQILQALDHGELLSIVSGFYSHGY